jgi:hypothetical protein
MPFEHIVLTDATLESALEFVYNHLDRDEYPDLIKSVQTIGGRLTDLELFVQKIKSGTTPDGKCPPPPSPSTLFVSVES